MVNNCASCGQIGNLVCKGCGKSPPYLDDTPSSTHYCNNACQKAHWSQHKARCKILQQRKTVHRAAKVLQELYYILFRKSMRTSIEKVDRVDEHTILVHTNDPDLDVKNSIVQGMSPGLLNASEELVALTMDCCTNAITTMGQSLEIMLKAV
ncbi:MAG: hypothetical protein Q9174_006251 [Haloplaca sp. 1 TL-2023]